MRRLLIGFAVLSLLAAGPAVRLARADGDSASPEEVQRGRQSLERMHREVVESEKQEKEQGAIARKRLATEFHVDASKMSDSDAIARLRDEIQDRDAAKEAAEQRRKEQAEAQREKQQRDLVKSQDAVLKQTFGKTSDELADDDDDDAAEQQMYESMVKQGVAPQCRGKKGQALVDCVDAAVGAE